LYAVAASSTPTSSKPRRTNRRIPRCSFSTSIAVPQYGLAPLVRPPAGRIVHASAQAEMVLPRLDKLGVYQLLFVFWRFQPFIGDYTFGPRHSNILASEPTSFLVCTQAIFFLFGHETRHQAITNNSRLAIHVSIDWV
jgi:hypothetical protein